MKAIYIDKESLERHEPSIVLEEDGVVTGRYTSIAGPGFTIKTHEPGEPRPNGQQGTRPKVWIEVHEDLRLLLVRKP